jgi:hypothetical protein
MIRIFFAALGVLFALLLVFCASFLGKLAFDMHDRGPAYEKLAVGITRDLARAWSIKDIETHYASAVAHRLDRAAAQAPFDALRPLGALRYVDDVRLQTGWTVATLRNVKSPAAAAEQLAELLSKTVKVTFLAKFANGFAQVTLALRNEGGKMKLWHLQIDSRTPLPQRTRRRPHPIAHA